MEAKRIRHRAERGDQVLRFTEQAEKVQGGIFGPVASWHFVVDV